MRLMQLTGCLLGFTVLCIAVPAFAGPSQAHPYLRSLIQQSVQKQLAKQRYWHLLLHYRKTLFGGDVSDADGPGFFLAPQGKTDPQAELEATLTQFFTDGPVGTSQQHAQCAFVARYHWLKSELSFDAQQLPEVTCDRFKAWLGGIDPESVTLIFASAYMNNPSSMFGHTLLRIDQRGQTDQTRLLAYVINYAANVTTENGLTYAVLGVSGGFQGFFSIMPYYLKVKEYSEMENRDIWEYRLTLKPDQIERMLMHAWELGNTYFDYYFFKENCSYHLLSLLEVADPDLHLTNRFRGWTIPADTVRAVAEQPGLVAATVYRPSRSTQIRSRQARLSGDEQRVLYRLTHELTPRLPPNMVGLAVLPAGRQALVLEVADDYLRYRSTMDEQHLEIYQAAQREVLEARSALQVQTDEVKAGPGPAPPDQGHQTTRVSLGIGWLDNQPFEQIAIRPVYHDLMDDVTGYPTGAQIELMHLTLRHEPHRNRTTVEELTLAKVVSLSPMDAYFMTPSWKVSAGLETVRLATCDACRVANVNAGVGAAIRAGAFRHELLYAMAELDTNYGDAFETRHRVGGGGTVGLMEDLTDRWRVHLTASYLAFLLGDRADDVRLAFHVRYTVHKHAAVRLEQNRRDRRDESVVMLHVYF